MNPENPDTGLLFTPKTALSVMGGSVDLIRQIVAAMEKDMPKQLDTLRRAAETENNSDARLAAHSIKGQAANVGAATIQELAANMENAARNGDIAQWAQEIPLLAEGCDTLLSQLRAYWP